ncbi:hypothetical protein [Halorubrum gandharaense]
MTADRPKGLVTVAGRPLLAWVFETVVEAAARDGVLAVEEVSREGASETGVIVVEDGAVQRIVEKPGTRGDDRVLRAAGGRF